MSLRSSEKAHNQQETTFLMATLQAKFATTLEKLEVNQAESSAGYFVHLACDGQNAAKFWPANDDGTLQFVEGLKTTEPFHAKSTPFPCNDAAVTELLTTRLLINLYKQKPDGSEEENPEPTLVGVASFPLSKIVSPEPDVVAVTLAFMSPPSTSTPNAEVDVAQLADNEEVIKKVGSVSLQVFADDNLSDQMLGGLKLSVYDATVANLPAEWKLNPSFDPNFSTAKAHHSFIETELEKKTQTFTAIFEGSVNDDNNTLPSFSLGEAVWKYERLEDGEAFEIPMTEDEMEAEKQSQITAHEQKKQQAEEAAAAAAAAAAATEEEGKHGDEKKDEGESKGEDAVEGEAHSNARATWQTNIMSFHVLLASAPTEEFIPNVPTTKFVPTPRAEWSLKFKEPNLSGVFISSTAVSSFNALINSDDGSIKIKLVRTGETTSYEDASAEVEDPADAKKGEKKVAKKGKAEESAAGEPIWIVRGSLDLSRLSIPAARTAPLVTKKVTVSDGDQDQNQDQDADEETKESRASLLSSRQNSIDSSNLQITVKVALSGVLRAAERSVVTPAMGMGHVVGLRQWKPKKKPRDVAGELRSEIKAIADQLSNEMQNTTTGKETDFFENIQTSGLYHAFLEKLRPAVQRAAHSRFREAPADGNLAAYRSELFTALASQLNTVLIDNFTDNEAVDNDLFPEPAASFAIEFDKIAMKAEECFVEGRIEEAMIQHESRVSVAKKAEATGDEKGKSMLSEAWNDFSKFCLVSKLPGSVDRALECIKQSNAILPLGVDMQILNALILLNVCVFDECEKTLEAAYLSCTQSQNSSLTTVHAAFCCLHDAMNELEKKVFNEDRESLRTRGLPMATFAKRDLTRCKKAKASLEAASSCCVETSSPPPRRAGVVAMLDVVEITTTFNLHNASQRALDIAQRCEDLASRKDTERSTAVDISVLASRRQRLESSQAIWTGSGKEAVEFALKSTELNSADSSNFIALGAAQANNANQLDAAAAYEKAMAIMGDGATLSVYLTLSILQQSLGNFERSMQVAFRATKTFGSALAWKLAGVALLKMEKLDDSKHALQESLRVDSLSASAWASLALVAVSGGEGTQAEAVLAAKQAICHDINDASLLRELGVAFNDVGDFELAEFMLRRSLVLQKSSHTRRVLGMVLNAQSQYEMALEEYIKLLDDNYFDNDEEGVFSKEEMVGVYKICVGLFEQIGNLKRREKLQFLEKFKEIMVQGD